MLEKKNIDRVFQENLRDMEIFPNKKVWNQIARELENEKVRPSQAPWKRIGAAAALAALVGLSAFFFFNTTDATVNPPAEISNTSNQIEEAPSNDNPVQLEQLILDPQEADLAQAGKAASERREAQDPIIGKRSPNQVIVTNQEIAKVYTNVENKYLVDEDKLREDLKEQESISDRMSSIPVVKEIQAPEKKWSVGPTVAPVFYNSLQDGSPINESLAGNSRSSDNSLSVGVKVNYQLNEKLHIQSGLNKVELAYNTRDVSAIATSSKFGSGLKNTTSSGYYLTPTRRPSAATGPDNLSKTGISGDLNQSLEYYELPIEMKYSLYDKRLGLNLVGGFSTLFLTGNSVSLVSGNNVTDLGDATNLNSFNFSGNVGIDLDYKISSSWYLNVAPMFKYQFNTYSGNSGNFRPYYFGLYSGLNFRF